MGEREKRTFELGFGESQPVSEPDSELLSESELERESDLVAAGGQSFRFFDFFCGAADLGCGAVGSKRCTPNIYYLVLEREFQYWGRGQLELNEYSRKLYLQTQTLCDSFLTRTVAYESRTYPKSQ